MKKILLLSCLLSNYYIYSQSLDSTFGNSGIITHQYSTTVSTDLTYAAAMQSDGKIIYVGKDINPLSAFVCRITTSGQLDNTFNNYGFKKINLTGLDNVFIQVNGKILVSGHETLLRLNSDGSQDNSFNINGSLTISINSQPLNTKSIVEQSDGKILVSGFTFNGTNNDFAIIRLNIDGSYDTTFDTDGKATFSIGNGNDESYGIALQTDGKIILTGQTNNGSNYDFATMRLNNNGSLDTSFANLGIAIEQFSGQDYGRSIDIQSNGKILIVGSGTANKLYAIRYNTNGSLDTTFDNDGILASTINLTSSTSTIDYTLRKPKIKYLSNDKILISGTSNSNFALIQLNNNGSLDNTFGTNGIVDFNVLASDSSNFLFVTSNNKIITGGGVFDGSSLYKMQQLQFTDTGVFENSSSYNLNVGSDNIIKMLEQPNGKIIALLDSPEGQTLRRYNQDGTIDTSFGNNGIIENFPDTIFKIEKQNDKIIVSFRNELFIHRYTNDGVLDTSFGIDGIVDFTLNSPNYVSFVDKLFYDQNSGFIYVAFDYDENIDTNLVAYLRSYGILRLNNDGTIDNSFGINGIGKMRFDYYNTMSLEFPSEICIQSNGKIVVAGFLNTTAGLADKVVGITRFNYNGTLDANFGNNGKVIAQTGSNTYPRQIINLNNDKFILNVSNEVSGNYISNSLKYDVNGTLDTTFGTNGVVSDGNYNIDMILQPDGKIVKAGDIISQFGIKRFNINGSIDTSFGNNGAIITPINYFSNINEILLLQDNKLLAGGSSFNGTNNLGIFAKYTNLNLETINFIEKNNSVLIYPNPIETNATIEFTLANEENISIEIIDFQGKIVKTVIKNKVINAGNHIQNIELNDNLASENYILKFNTSKGSQSIKIIKK
jgi:uncharacterized delta-60 repeat protein